MQVPLLDGSKAERELGLKYHSAKEVRRSCAATHNPRERLRRLLPPHGVAMSWQRGCPIPRPSLGLARRLQAFLEELQAVEAARQRAAQAGGA